MADERIDDKRADRAASPVVAAVRCSSYDEAAVDDAVGRGIDLLGGIERFAAPQETILLKPNLLVPRDAARAVTTHPSVFRAVARRFIDAGAHVTYGDSPGFGGPAFVARRSGIAAVAEDPVSYTHLRAHET